MLKEPLKLGQFQNGLSQLGKMQQNKWVTLDNCDIHSETGLIAPNLAFISESTTPSEACFSAIAPNGDVYFCSKSSGKIWKRAASNGAYTLAHTNANTSHTGCRYFNGYLWFWTATKLGHFNLDSTWTDSFATGTNFKEGIESSNTLIIANGRYIARIDATNTFSANELTLPAQYNATCLKDLGDDVLIGTIVGSNVAYCKIYLWNKVDTSYTYEDEIFEIGVNCFLQLDNIVLAQCGTTGRFYYWTGSKMNYFGKIRGITTAAGEQMSAVYNGRCLFANATKVYSIHKEDNALNYAFCGEYTATGTIASILIQGQQILTSVGTGINKLGTTYATATIESPEIQTEISEVKVGYDVYPEGIGIQTSINGATYVSQTEIIDTIKREVGFNGGLVDGYTTQVKLILTPDGANIPKVKYITYK
jgi:hypothetical protein